MLLEEIKKNYNNIPYNSLTYRNSLPHRQKANLKIFNFQTPDLETARILELGCSFGANIMSYAMAYENSECIGIDISNFEIENGNKIIEELDIKNLKLYEKNILDYNNEFGKFDYIICHGVFSWVPENVQRKILEIISSSLVENGSAMISYNAYPGWKFYEIIKESINYRLNETGILEKTFSVEEFMECVIETIEFLKTNNNYSNEKIEILDNIKKTSYDYIYHEYIGKINEPFYLYKFNELLKEYGLKHIIDSNLYVSFPDDMNKILKKEHIEREQYFDFLHNTSFRHSIITHINNDIKIKDEIDIENIDDIYVRAKFNKENNEYVFKNISFLDISIYEDILNYIYFKYPQFIKIEEIAKKFKDNKELAYILLLNLIIKEEVDYISENVKIEDKKVLKISDKYRKYFKYLLKRNNGYVKIGDFIGNMTSLSIRDIENILLFDGVKTDEEIIEILKTKDGYSSNEEIVEYLSRIRNFIVSSKYNE